jgi:hypothetical protein
LISEYKLLREGISIWGSAPHYHSSLPPELVGTAHRYLIDMGAVSEVRIPAGILHILPSKGSTIQGLRSHGLATVGRFHPFYRPRRPLGRVEVRLYSVL